MVAVPETRPTTIEGWTVREVRGATAILRGPRRRLDGDTRGYGAGCGPHQFDRALGQPLDRSNGWRIDRRAINRFGQLEQMDRRVVVPEEAAWRTLAA